MTFPKFSILNPFSILSLNIFKTLWLKKNQTRGGKWPSKIRDYVLIQILSICNLFEIQIPFHFKVIAKKYFF